MRDSIQVIFEKNVVSFVDNGKLITKGSSPKYHAMASNVINNADIRYKRSEVTEHNKRVVTLEKD